MESMNLLDITIKYFNIIVFILCVIFGTTSIFASWIAWREIQRKRNIIRSIVAAYNIAENTLEKGSGRSGELHLDPSVVQTVFNTIQEILNAMYGELTGKPIPPIDERAHGSRRKSALAKVSGIFKKKPLHEGPIQEIAPPLVTTKKDHHQNLHP